MSVLATHPPFTIVWPMPQPKATRVIMPSARGIGAGDIAWTDVEANKARTEPEINLTIFFSCNVSIYLRHADEQTARRC
jgi:hypothetical protein